MFDQLDSFPPLDEALDIANGLLAGWKSYARNDRMFSFAQRNKKHNLAKFVSVYALAAHTHHLGNRVLPWLAEEALVEATPLVRFMYEDAITCMWLAQTDDGAQAFINQDTKNRHAVADTLRKTTSPHLRAAADTYPGLDAVEHPTSSAEQARNFERRCSDLTPGGADLYLPYRLMSRLSHPAYQLIDMYLVGDNTGAVTALRTTPDEDPTSNRDLTVFAAAALTWAGTAVDYIDPDHTRRSELRIAAHDLGIERDLHLTEAARKRINAKAKKPRELR